MSQEIDVSINFQIKSIELLETNLKTTEASVLDKSNFQFEITIEHRVQAEGEFIAVVCSISICKEDRKDDVIGMVKASCIYTIENLASFLDATTGEFALPVLLLTTLNSISLSTIRGMMFNIFKGTILHNAILPVLDPNTLAPLQKK